MVATVVHLTVILSILISITVSSDVFKAVGNSLDIPVDRTEQNIQKFKELIWLFKAKYIYKYNLEWNEGTDDFSGYKGRVEFNEIKFSLTLKNLTKNDAGEYSVKGVAEEEEHVIIKQTLIVLDPVAPSLTYSRPQQSSNTCNVTCKIQSLSVSINCSKETCKAKNETTPSSDHALSLYVNHTTAICIASNKAMTNKTTMDISLCFQGSHMHLYTPSLYAMINMLLDSYMSVTDSLPISGPAPSKGSISTDSLRSCAVVLFTVLLGMFLS